MKLNVSRLANPYYLFAVVWGFCLYFYSLRWATIYPELSLNLLAFTLIAIALSVFVGFLFQKFSNAYAVKNTVIFKVERLVILNVVLWVANFAYSGIPLLNASSGKEFDHLIAFGIPSLIVFVVSFTGFLSLMCFYYYLESKVLKYLIYYFINLSFFLLIFSRGSIMMTVMSTFFLWLFVNKSKVGLPKIFAIASSFIMLIYLFGVAGNFRTIKEFDHHNLTTNTEYSSTIILEIADASPSFRNSKIPGEFMWGYTYLTSPIGNLEENINRAKVDINSENVFSFIINEFTWDFISKRLVEFLGLKKYETFSFVDELAVTTTFAEPYLYLGWLGIYIYLAAILCLPFLYFIFVGRNPLWKVGMAVMCSIYFFSIFDNMFINSGLCLQLIYPLVFIKKISVNN